MRLVPALLFASMAVPINAVRSQSAAGHTVPVPTAVAARRTTPIVLDAKLDEDAWKAATPITEFRQIDPDEGKPGTQRTEVRFLFDDDALYVGAKMYDLSLIHI